MISTAVTPNEASRPSCARAPSSVPSGVKVPDVHLVDDELGDRPARPRAARRREAPRIDDLVEQDKMVARIQPRPAA
jgi:hypothetical protein